MNWFFLNADQNYSITSGWLDQKSGGFTKRFESLRTNSMHRLAGNTPWSTYVRNTSRVLGFWILFCLLLNLEHLVFNNALWKKKKERKKNIHKRNSIVMVRQCNAHSCNINPAHRAQERQMFALNCTQYCTC